MNGKVNQGPLYDINVLFNRSSETMLHSINSLAIGLPNASVNQKQNDFLFTCRTYSAHMHTQERSQRGCRWGRVPQQIKLKITKKQEKGENSKENWKK